MAPAATVMTRAVVMAVLLLMQYSNVVLAARPLQLQAAANGGGGCHLGKDAGALTTIRQLLAMAVGPGEGNPYDFQDPNYTSPDMSSLIP